MTVISGSPRRTGTITVFSEDGRFKAVLNDRQSGSACFVTSDSALGLLDAAEVILADGKGDWRTKKK